MKVLKVLVAVFALCFPLPSIAENESAPPTAACGDLQVSMAVDLDKSHSPLAGPEPGKALIYFVQDRGLEAKIGIEGRWVGANKGPSWFPISVAAGITCAPPSSPPLLLMILSWRI